MAVPIPKRIRPQLPGPTVSRKPRSTPRRYAAAKETHTMATASHRNNRVVLVRSPAASMWIFEPSMRAQSNRGCTPSQSDIGSVEHGGPGKQRARHRRRHRANCARSHGDLSLLDGLCGGAEPGQNAAPIGKDSIAGQVRHAQVDAKPKPFRWPSCMLATAIGEHGVYGSPAVWAR